MTSLIFRLFPKMAFSEEDKHVIKFLRQTKHYGAKRFLKEFPHKGWSCSGLDNIIRKIDRTGTSQRLSAVAVRALLEWMTKLKKLKHLF